jgi:lysophospholipase L1-like esterase
MRKLIINLVILLIFFKLVEAQSQYPDRNNILQYIKKDAIKTVLPVKIMPLGNSITQGDWVGGYRRLLKNTLNAAGYETDFVGSQVTNASQDLGLFTDIQHEGYNSATISINSVHTHQNFIRSTITTYTPDIVLVELGTNDLSNGTQTPAMVRTSMSKFLDTIWAIQPSTKIAVSLVTPVNHAIVTAAWGDSIVPLNVCYTSLVAEKLALGRNIVLVDNYSAITDPANDLQSDGIHPLQPGYAKMAAAWYLKVKELIDGISSPPAAPLLSFPSNGSIDQPVQLTLKWHLSLTADSYRVQLATDSNFESDIVIDDSLTADSLEIDHSLANGLNYYWRVCAKNNGGTSPWSATWSFTTLISQTPILLSPLNGAVSQSTTLTLLWHSFDAANFYQIQVSLNPSFTNLLVDDSTLTDTSRSIESLINTKTYYWRVRAKKSIGVSGYSEVWNFTVLLSGTHIYQVSDRWNIVSVPLITNSFEKSILFPTSTSDAWAYDSKYVRCDTLENGKGYWLKFSSDQEVVLIGASDSADTIEVVKGWNLIGSVSNPVLISSIISDPPGIITGNFFRYSDGYIKIDTIFPGKGYWVKVNQPGKLILSTRPTLAASSRIKIVPTSDLPPSPPDGSTAVEQTIPNEYGLEQAYPNPFNPTTTIKYQLPVDSKVTLKVYDLLGQVVQTLVDGMESAGYKSKEWNAGTVASGIYFYRLEATSVSDPTKNFTQVKKMLLIR